MRIASETAELPSGNELRGGLDNPIARLMGTAWLTSDHTDWKPLRVAGMEVGRSPDSKEPRT